jgi:hypothetical protein
MMDRKKSNLMSKVEHYTSSDNIPQILPPRGGSLNDIIALSCAMGVAIGNIMQRSVNTFRRTKYFIKQFLSAFH